MQHIYDMIIIGGGPCGYTAALYAARAGLDAVLIEKLCVGGQMALTGDIDNYPGFESGVDGFTLGMKMQQTAERFGAKTLYKEVVGIKDGGKIKEVLTGDETLFAKTVVIATGANPKKLGIEREDEFVGRGVHYCAHCDGRFYKGKTVAVVGGGNSAVADALYLSRLAQKVYLIHRRDELRADKIYYEPLLSSENIELVFNSSVKEIVAEGKVSGVVVENTQSKEQTKLDCDAVFISIGRKPITEFLSRDIKLDTNGYIIADESTKTNIEGVFAAGDVRTKALRQVVTAVSDGAVAVHYAQEYLTKIK